MLKAWQAKLWLLPANTRSDSSLREGLSNGSFDNSTFIFDWLWTINCCVEHIIYLAPTTVVSIKETVVCRIIVKSVKPNPFPRILGGPSNLSSKQVNKVRNVICNQGNVIWRNIDLLFHLTQSFYNCITSIISIFLSWISVHFSTYLITSIVCSGLTKV